MSDLEFHIKTAHDKHKSFQCSKCEKMFVTKWRLARHTKMHSKIFFRKCKYFQNRVKCPFEDLGCKFGHFQENTKDKLDKEETVDELETKNDKDMTYENYTMDVSNETDIHKDNVVDTVDERDVITNRTEKSKFYTSTPKKILKECAGCVNSSQCVVCIMKHVLAGHGDYTWR